MDHIISGVAINLLAVNGTTFLVRQVFNSEGREASVPAAIPVGAFVLAAFVLVAVVHFVLNRTAFGLRLTAVGESPESARMSGLNPARLRLIGVTLSGILAAVGGRLSRPLADYAFQRQHGERPRLHRAGRRRLRPLASHRSGRRLSRLRLLRCPPDPASGPRPAPHRVPPDDAVRLHRSSPPCCSGPVPPAALGRTERLNASRFLPIISSAQHLSASRR